MKHIPKLYHISFKRFNDHVWNPKHPDGMETNGKYIKKANGHIEPDLKRICCSQSLKGCFMAVYSNVSHYFELPKYNYPYMDFFYYMPEIPKNIKDEDILSHQELTDKNYVWDAHITKEWSILIPVKMICKGKVRFHNTVNTNVDEWIKTFPFNDDKNKERIICPPLRYEIMERF